MKCAYFEQQKCLSCRHLSMPMAEQLAAKSQVLRDLLAPFNVQTWCSPVFGPEAGFRNKAKMVALGAAHQPILGLLSPTGEAVSLCDCSLYPADMQQLLHRLETFVQQAGIAPYRVDKAKGELKFVLLTRSQVRGEYLLRFVLRSTHAIERIERELPRLLRDYPQIKVVSVNLQPVHMAILEGEQEIFLTEATRLEERFNDVPLFIRPKSFFQTHPEVAEKLYQSAREWVGELAPDSLWDLFCGVGGFGLHCATYDPTRLGEIALTGIEIEAEAIACAKMSAEAMGLENVSFSALDSTQFATGEQALDKPDVVIVNPPRRGIGEALCQSLNAFAPKAILYSSCNPQTLANDLQHLVAVSLDGAKSTGRYTISKVQLFDMFPHTSHFEVLCLLVKSD